MVKSQTRPLADIAYDIFRNWKNVSPHARPYLSAMFEMDKIEDPYYADPTCAFTVLYFLSNAQGWRGEDARRIKKELNAMCKELNGY